MREIQIPMATSAVRMDKDVLRRNSGVSQLIAIGRDKMQAEFLTL